MTDGHSGANQTGARRKRVYEYLPVISQSQRGKLQINGRSFARISALEGSGTPRSLSVARTSSNQPEKRRGRRYRVATGFFTWKFPLDPIHQCVSTRGANRGRTRLLGLFTILPFRRTQRSRWKLAAMGTMERDKCLWTPDKYPKEWIPPSRKGLSTGWTCFCIGLCISPNLTLLRSQSYIVEVRH